MRALILLAAALLATPALAQDAASDTLVVTPGRALATDWITPGTTTWTLRLVQPVQQNVGTITEAYDVAGDEVVRVTTLSIPMQGLTQTDSLVAAASTLAPRLHRSSGGMLDLSLEFMDEGVVGTVTPRDGSTDTVMETTDTPVFDGAWLTEIARSLPLAEDLVARVPVFTAQGGLADAVLTVTGQEEVETAEGVRTGWTVEMVAGPQVVTNVIDAETSEVLVTRLSPQPGVVIEAVPAD